MIKEQHKEGGKETMGEKGKGRTTERKKRKNKEIRKC